MNDAQRVGQYRVQLSVQKPVGRLDLQMDLQKPGHMYTIYCNNYSRNLLAAALSHKIPILLC